VACPWAWPFHGSYLSQGPPSGGMSTSRVRLFPTGTRTMALKPPFSSLCYCFGLRLNLATPSLGDALLWRCFILGGASFWVMPRLGDTSCWRRFLLAPLTLGDASSGQSVDFLPWPPRMVSLYVDFDLIVDFDFGQRLGTGRYKVK